MTEILTYKFDVSTHRLLAILDVPEQNNASLSFLFKANAGFQFDSATHSPRNDDGSLLSAVTIRSFPYGDGEGIYTAQGTIDGMKKLTAISSVASIMKAAKLLPTASQAPG